LKHINAIERVQRRFTKRIPALQDLPNEERLAILNLETLEYRRVKSDLTFYYKIVHNLSIWCPASTFDILTPVRETRLTAGSTLLINKPLCNTAVYQNDFFQRCINCWNSLSKEVVEAKTINAFNDFISRVDLTKFLFYRF